MILHAQAKHGKPGLPWLVFLHGFSGDCHEWQEVGEAFADYSRLYVDLPGHGGSATISVDGFDDVTAYCVKRWLVTTYLTSGWWGTRLADGWR
ncbi:acyl-CoA thioester hydrolase [Escherichia coli]|uniref:Acyl-CoA thioester hydrolase n=1 Tax=Escherichia coli TaxID=562 RepID=A0A484X366_ECOLX|nr:acyl-CoA thioester hydrolase [Escherichia coli]